MNAVIVVSKNQSEEVRKVIEANKPYEHLDIQPYTSSVDETSDIFLLTEWTPGTICAVCQDIEDRDVRYQIFIS
jgi:hypothetical protein